MAAIFVYMKKSYIYKNITYDSQEEIDFVIFLEEAKKYKLIKKYIYQPPSYELSPKAVYYDINGKKKTLRAHNYTADFLIYPNSLFNELNHGLIPNKDKTFLIDVKGTFNKNGGDRILPIHQKWMFDKYKLFVNKVIPELFFKQANIAPEALRWNKNIKKEKVLKKAFKSLDSFPDFLKRVKCKQQTGKQININLFS